MSNWNYEALGFRSQKEMEESIERVKAAKANPMNDSELRAYNRQKTDELINPNGGIDFKGLEEGARLSELDRVVASKLYQEKEAEKQRAEQEELDKLLKAAAESSALDKKAKAEKMIKEEQAKHQKELEQEAKRIYGVDSTDEIRKNEAYKAMLNGLGLDKE